LFRHAVAYAIDADALISSVFLSHADRTLSPVNPSSWLYAPALRSYPHDKDLAGALLERVRSGETEYESETNLPDDGEGGTLTGSPVRSVVHSFPLLRILVNEENDERVRIAWAVYDAVSSLGLVAHMDILPFDDFRAKLETGDYDIFVGQYLLSLIPDLRFAFATSGISDGSNLLSYSDTELDRLLSEAFHAVSEERYKNAMHNVQIRLAEELPVISLAFRRSAVLTDTRVHGALSPSVNSIFANVHKWFILP
jgi:peptide/nickel transport system substrate-binding protein